MIKIIPCVHHRKSLVENFIIPFRIKSCLCVDELVGELVSKIAKTFLYMFIDSCIVA